MYFSNLSSPLYSTVKDYQVHHRSSPCLQQAFEISIPPENPLLSPVCIFAARLRVLLQLQWTVPIYFQAFLPQVSEILPEAFL